MQIQNPNTPLSGEISNCGDLIKYIRLMLGEPLIQVELQDVHINQVIRDVVKLYTDVVYGNFETSTLVETSCNPNHQVDRIRLIDWDEVTSVTSQDGKNFTPFKWDSIKRSLEITGSINPRQTLIVHGQKRYHVDEEFDLIFNESWVKEMSKAKVQLLWGQVLGKYNQSLVGGASINYDRLISEAQSDIDRLMEELHEKWVDPAPVLVG